MLDMKTSEESELRLGAIIEPYVGMMEQGFLNKFIEGGDVRACALG